jgi:hypothetical protein
MASKVEHLAEHYLFNDYGMYRKHFQDTNWRNTRATELTLTYPE